MFKAIPSNKRNHLHEYILYISVVNMFFVMFLKNYHFSFSPYVLICSFTMSTNSLYLSDSSTQKMPSSEKSSVESLLLLLKNIKNIRIRRVYTSIQRRIYSRPLPPIQSVGLFCVFYGVDVHSLANC